MNYETINIYSMVANKKRIEEYRKNEMEKNIPFEDRVLKAVTNDKRILTDIEDSISLNKLKSIESGMFGGSYYHLLEKYNLTEEEIVRQNKLLDSFYKGTFQKSKVVKIHVYSLERRRLEIIKYLLLTSNYHMNINFDYEMNDIIVIPKALYLLQMLEQGKFDSIMDENLTDQLGLFDISDKPIERLNINKLKRIYDYGLFPGVFEAVIADVEKSQKVLQKIPKNRE